MYIEDMYYAYVCYDFKYHKICIHKPTIIFSILYITSLINKYATVSSN